jgi:hypothetical protein
VGWILSATLNRGDSLSLTGSRDLHNDVEVHGGRVIRPIFQGGPPCQLFNAFNLPESEVANRILVMGFEINIDLLGCGSKPMSLYMATHRWCSPSKVPRREDQHPSRNPVLACVV